MNTLTTTLMSGKEQYLQRAKGYICNNLRTDRELQEKMESITDFEVLEQMNRFLREVARNKANTHLEISRVLGVENGVQSKVLKYSQVAQNLPDLPKKAKDRRVETPEFGVDEMLAENAALHEVIWNLAIGLNACYEILKDSQKGYHPKGNLDFRMLLEDGETSWWSVQLDNLFDSLHNA